MYNRFDAGCTKAYVRAVAARARVLTQNASQDEEERKKFPVETRMYNRIGKHCVKAYEHAVAALDEKDADFAQKGWWLRVHLLVDHISSMTDAYALETYQMLEGIALMRT